MGFAITGSKRWIYHIATLAICTGLLLSLASWLHICTEECAKSHNYRLFGMPFEYVGIAFFLTLGGCHLTLRKHPLLGIIALLLIALGLGAEVMFVLVQKYQIGVWCPLCLSIGSTIAAAAICYGIGYFQELTNSLNPFYKGEYMKIGLRGIASLSAFAIGFLMAFVGISKEDQLQAAQETIKSQLWFGHQSSPIEVYLFTDWACPACRKLEPEIEHMLPDIIQDSKFLFVDFAVHPQTYNYTPFNVSFMVNNKQNYLELRRALTELSLVNNAPTEQQVDSVISPLGQKYSPLNFADVALTTKYYKDLGKKFSIDATPTMVIVNVASKKGKKLAGTEEITTANVLKTINALK